MCLYHVRFSWLLFALICWFCKSLRMKGWLVVQITYHVRSSTDNNQQWSIQSHSSYSLRLIIMHQILAIMLLGNPIKLYIPYYAPIMLWLCSIYSFALLHKMIYCNLSFMCQVHYFQGLKPIQAEVGFSSPSFAFFFLLME